MCVGCLYQVSLFGCRLAHRALTSVPLHLVGALQVEISLAENPGTLVQIDRRTLDGHLTGRLKVHVAPGLDLDVLA